MVYTQEGVYMDPRQEKRGDIMKFDDNIELENFGNQSMAFDYTKNTPAEFGATSVAKPDITMLKNEIAKALASTSGVLGAKHGISVVTAQEGLASTIHAGVGDDNRMSVRVKIIASNRRDPGDIIADATRRIAETLHTELGEEPCEILVSIHTVMPETEFNSRYC